MTIEQIKETIKPFAFHEIESFRKKGKISYSMTLYADVNYKARVFESRAEEGFEGNGCDWASLAEVFLDEIMPELSDVIRFDSEAGMFCAYCYDNREAMKDFAFGFSSACKDDKLLLDLFSRAVLD